MFIDSKSCAATLAALAVVVFALYSMGRMVAGWL